MTLYLAGPMSSLPDFNFPAFHEAARQLRAAGYEVVTTAECCDDTSQPWDYYMRRAIKALVDCDAVALLYGWDASRGARLELHIAQGLGMLWGTLGHWLEAAQS